MGAFLLLVVAIPLVFEEFADFSAPAATKSSIWAHDGKTINLLAHESIWKELRKMEIVDYMYVLTYTTFTLQNRAEPNSAGLAVRTMLAWFSPAHFSSVLWYQLSALFSFSIV